MAFASRITLLLVVALAWNGLTGAASAHAHLKSASPAPGAAVVAPSEIRLTFNEAVEPSLSSLELRREDGALIATKKPALAAGDPATLIVEPVEKLAPGFYRAHWRAVSADTHKTQGDFRFEVRP